MRTMAYIDLDSGDRELFKIIFDEIVAKQNCGHIELICFSGSEDFLEYTINKCKNPHFIVADRELGKMSAFDLERILNELPIVRYIPFYIFSSSTRIYDTHLISGYLIKPCDYNAYYLTVNQFVEKFNQKSLPI